MAGERPAVLIEADGGSRGNPGQAAYGAVLLDARTGGVIAERAEHIGVATNNVAEYRGLIAGLELYHEHAEGAPLEVRMDSKLVVEQMSGRWRIKHPDMKPLALAANRLAPAGTTYTWIPREKNKHADRILNEALDRAARAASQPEPSPDVEPVEPSRVVEPVETTPTPPARGWSSGSTPTTLVLVRHGVTAHTVDKRFSSGLGGEDPGLTADGRAQARATADWLAPLAEEVDAVVSSPLRRTRETAEIIGERLGRTVDLDRGLAEMEFGRWDGKTFAEVRESHPDDLEAWLGSLHQQPPGGESFSQVQERVLASLDALLSTYSGRTVLAVTHVTPIKVLVARTLGAPLDAVFRMELAPASVTVLSFYADGTASMRLFNARPMEEAFIGR
ncbi:MAG: bifunctional RNase H/acid phosphatase [Nocardioidaceae bacterium]